jgi:hypothetical protein
MLETMREYAQELLCRSGELEIVQQAHALYYLALTEEAEPELFRPQQTIWLERSMPTCAPSTVNSTLPHGRRRPILPSNSGFSRCIFPSPLLLEPCALPLTSQTGLLA